jgi:carboxymethylenebutenolidase
MSEPRTVPVSTADGEMDLYVWTPPSGSGPGILLLQEIFGVGVYLRGVAERLTAMGYTVGAPDVFWRIEPGYQSDHTPEGLQRSLGMMPKFVPQFEQGVADCVDAFGVLSSLPEVSGGTGVLGFCLGGTLAWLVAAQAEPSCCVSYYGSGVHQARGLAQAITCPTLLHFGAKDGYIPNEQVDDVRAAIAGAGRFDLRVWEAGHAFDNFDAEMFHDADAAAAAWSVTSTFLAEHLPTA